MNGSFSDGCAGTSCWYSSGEYNKSSSPTRRGVDAVVDTNAGVAAPTPVSVKFVKAIAYTRGIDAKCQLTKPTVPVVTNVLASRERFDR